MPRPKLAPSILPALASTIAARRTASPDRSYVAQLIAAGPRAMMAKIAEEAAELEEQVNPKGRRGSPARVREAADLVFHVLVLLGWSRVNWSDVEFELKRRFGTSGLAEKAARRTSQRRSRA